MTMGSKGSQPKASSLEERDKEPEAEASCKGGEALEPRDREDIGTCHVCTAKIVSNEMPTTACFVELKNEDGTFGNIKVNEPFANFSFAH